MSDLISRKAAIEAMLELQKEDDDAYGCHIPEAFHGERAAEALKSLPSAQPDGIPLEWIDKHLEWLDNCDNDFAQLAKVGIRAMVEIWKKDKT